MERPRPVPGGRDAEADPFLAGRGAVRREGVPLRPREPRDQHVHVALHAVVPPLWFLKRDLDAGTEPLEDGVLDAQRAVAERVERVGAVDGERRARDGRAHASVAHDGHGAGDAEQHVHGLPNLKRHEGARPSCHEHEDGRAAAHRGEATSPGTAAQLDSQLPSY